MLTEEQKKKIYEDGFNFEMNNGGCAQCTLASIKENLGTVTDDTFKAATALAGGAAASGHCCGGFTGGILAISSFLGRDWENFATEEGNDNKNKATMLARKLLAKFEEEYGSCNCADIHEKVYGKVYHMYIPEEKAAFLEAGGHGPNGCTKVVGNAAVWTAEILDEAGLLDK